MQAVTLRGSIASPRQAAARYGNNSEALADSETKTKNRFEVVDGMRSRMIEPAIRENGPDLV